MLIWSCKKCGGSVPQDCDICNHCGFDPSLPSISGSHGYPPGSCLRCQSPMTCLGTMRLHEGTRLWPFLLGNVGELMVDRKRFETFACTNCGKVEFFIPPDPDLAH